ncbi:hypothetical protein A0H81_00674 [Grifola frondosa]|uniref:Uncharacterized protein n=1 Tax=Grifola frondosa TaxID=5627 RepID=A0A1C7MRH4_GRIFR|nr:hypothetical protein A0H81_00674 [Grifola frondosa]
MPASEIDDIFASKGKASGHLCPQLPPLCPLSSLKRRGRKRRRPRENTRTTLTLRSRPMTPAENPPNGGHQKPSWILLLISLPHKEPSRQGGAHYWRRDEKEEAEGWQRRGPFQRLQRHWTEYVFVNRVSVDLQPLLPQGRRTEEGFAIYKETNSVSRTKAAIRHYVRLIVNAVSECTTIVYYYPLIIYTFGRLVIRDLSALSKPRIPSRQWYPRALNLKRILCALRCGKYIPRKMSNCYGESCMCIVSRNNVRSRVSQCAVSLVSPFRLYRSLVYRTQWLLEVNV